MYGGGGEFSETVFGVVLAVSIGISFVVSFFAVNWLEPRRRALAIFFTVVMTSMFPFIILLLMPSQEAQAMVRGLLFAPHPQWLIGTRIGFALVFVLAWCGIEALTLGGFSLSGFFGGEDLPDGNKRAGPPPPVPAKPVSKQPSPRAPRQGFGHRGVAR